MPNGTEVVIKRDYSERGNHVQIIPIEKLSGFDAKGFGDFVIQRRIIQLDSLTKLAAGQQATLRLITAFPAGSVGPILVSGLMKYQVGAGSQDLMRIVLQTKTGKFCDFGMDSSWRKVPLSELGLGELVLPNLDQAQQLVLDLHASFPHFQLIGWDLGLDRDGNPWIFEWNADHPAIYFHQIALGPILSSLGIKKQ